MNSSKSAATVAIVACLLGLALRPPPVGATPLLGCGADGILYDVDPATGQASNPRATAAEHLAGIDFSPDGELWSLTSSWIVPVEDGVLMRIDPATGAYVTSRALGGGAWGEGDLAFAPGTMSLYYMTSYSTMPDGTPAIPGADDLESYDLSAGVRTYIGQIDGYVDVSALAFDGAGTLYMLDTYGDRLLRVDPSDTGILGSVPLSTPLGTTAGMDFDPATGVLYVADGCDAGTDMLYTLDTDTGVLTPIGPTGLSEGLAGIAFVPEPGTLALLGLGAMLAVRRLTRKELRQRGSGAA